MQATISFTLFSLGLTGSTGNVFLMLKMILTKTAFTLTVTVMLMMLMMLTMMMI